MTYPYDNNRFSIKDALPWVAIGVLFLLFGLTWWRMDALDDRLSRMPVVRPSVVSVGDYASVRVYKDNQWDLTPEPEPTVKEVFKNKGGKK